MLAQRNRLDFYVGFLPFCCFGKLNIGKDASSIALTEVAQVLWLFNVVCEVDPGVFSVSKNNDLVISSTFQNFATNTNLPLVSVDQEFKYEFYKNRFIEK